MTEVTPATKIEERLVRRADKLLLKLNKHLTVWDRDDYVDDINVMFALRQDMTTWMELKQKALNICSSKKGFDCSLLMEHLYRSIKLRRNADRRFIEKRSIIDKTIWSVVESSILHDDYIDEALIAYAKTRVCMLIKKAKNGDKLSTDEKLEKIHLKKVRDSGKYNVKRVLMMIPVFKTFIKEIIEPRLYSMIYQLLN